MINLINIKWILKKEIELLEEEKLYISNILTQQLLVIIYCLKQLALNQKKHLFGIKSNKICVINNLTHL